VDQHLCTGSFHPAWLDGSGAGLDDAHLLAMTDETSQRLQPFWEAICARAPKAVRGEPVCPME
jgi:hypothetical protein